MRRNSGFRRSQGATFLFAASLFLSSGPLELSLRSGHSPQVKYGGALSLALASSAPVSVSNTNIEDENSQSCSWEDQQDDSSDCRQDLDHSPHDLNLRDPNLIPMSVDLDGTEKEPFYVYKSPDISTFYNSTPGTIREQVPHHKGLMAKFINLSNQAIRIFWVPTESNSPNVYIADVEPFGSAGTASHPGHTFVYTPQKDPGTVLLQVTVVAPTSIYPFDPYGSVDKASAELTASELDLYRLQWENLRFSELYRNATNREWLALYQRKEPPKYFMWPANSFGETFSVETQETHFVSLPVEHADRQSEMMRRLRREDLAPYRDPTSSSLNLTLKVLSVEPRVFEIQDFLSEAEITHILEIAANMRLSQSTTKAGADGERRTDDSTRSSMNSWISRERSPILDSIYRRAADLLRIDEALFRYRKQDEPRILETKEPICERLQLVHYRVGQQYTPHHVSALLVGRLVGRRASTLSHV